MDSAAQEDQDNVRTEVVQPLFEEKSKDPTVLPTKATNVVEVSTPYSRKKQLLATLCATMGCFLYGGIIGYTGPANPSLMDKEGTDIYGNSFFVSFQSISWITSILGLGSFFGAFTAGFIMDKIGRRMMMMVVTSATFFVGYALIFFAAHVIMIYIGRFLGGMALGFELCTVTVYIVEIATIDMRGLLGCFVQLMGCIGIVFTFCVGAAVDWKYLAVANGLWAPVFSLCMYFAPESPRWLILKGREYSAMRSLEWLRGKDQRDAVEKEIDIIKRDIATSKRQHISMAMILEHWRPFIVALNMMFILHFSGFNVLVYYTINIFQFARSSVDARVAGIVVGITLLVSCLCAVVIVAKLNRKPLLMASILGMAFCQLVIGYCMQHNEGILGEIMQRAEEAWEKGPDALMSEYGLPDNSTRTQLQAYFTELHDFPSFLGWLPVVAVIGFLFMGNAGYGTLIWIVTAEMLPPKIRSAANSICICFGFVGGFLVAKTFVDLIGAINNSGTFYLYSGICFMGFLFTVVFVPETKNKTQEEIQASLNRSLVERCRDAFCCGRK